MYDHPDKMKTIEDSISRFRVSMETMYKDRMNNCVKFMYSKWPTCESILLIYGKINIY